MTIAIPSTVKFVAALPHVREVALIGTADLAFWQHRLDGEHLFAVPHEGRAKLLVTATDSKFLGKPFREFSVSIFVSRKPNEMEPEGAFLVHAFNSSKLFAWVERTCFSTPYYYGQIQLSVNSPIFATLSQHEIPVFRAKLSSPTTGSRSPLRIGEEGFAGPLFLPGNPRHTSGQRKFFYAKIAGQSDVYDWDAGSDLLSIDPAADVPVLRHLIESQFTVSQWHIRPDAQHAKSKTYRRDQLERPLDASHPG